MEEVNFNKDSKNQSQTYPCHHSSTLHPFYLVGVGLFEFYSTTALRKIPPLFNLTGCFSLVVQTYQTLTFSHLKPATLRIILHVPLHMPINEKKRKKENFSVFPFKGITSSLKKNIGGPADNPGRIKISATQKP